MLSSSPFCIFNDDLTPSLKFIEVDFLQFQKRSTATDTDFCQTAVEKCLFSKLVQI